MIEVFHKKHYIIEMKLGGAFLDPLSEVYNVKDANSGSILGYVKKQKLKLWPKFWFEGTDGTKMGEIHSSMTAYKFYDARKQLRATIIEKQRSPRNKKKSLLGVVLFVSGLPLLILATVLYYHTTFSPSFFAAVFVGLTLTGFGVYCLVSTFKKPEWYVENHEGQKLAEIKDAGRFLKEYQVVSPDGAVVAYIHKKRGLSAFRYSYSIDIISEVVESRVIIGFTILMADVDKTMATSAPSFSTIVV